MKLKFIPLVLLAAAPILLGCGTPVYSDPQGHFTVELTGGWYEQTDALSDLSEKGDEFVLSLGAFHERTEAYFVVKIWKSPLCERCENLIRGNSGDGQRLLGFAKDWLWEAQNKIRDVVSHGDIVLVEGERGLFVEVETTHDTTKSIRRFYASQSGVMLETICGATKSRWRLSMCTDILDTLVVSR